MKHMRGTGRAHRNDTGAPSELGPTLSRRGFLVGAAGGIVFAGTGCLVSGPFAREAVAATPRVVVVGGGLAGTTAAYRINRLKGWVPHLYEAQTRIGGRTKRITGLSGGQYAEAGGGGINERDTAIRNLAQEIGLGLWPLDDTWDNYPDGAELYVFGGQRYSWNQLKSQVNENYGACWRAWVKMGKGIPTYKKHSAAAARYDRMTVREFLNTECPNGTNTVGGRYMASSFEVEYAGRVDEASAMHLILDGAGIWGGGGWNERYAIPGGNASLSEALADALPEGNVHLGHALVALRRNGDDSYTLTFDEDGGGLVDVDADRVVLAVPPTTLRDVDLTEAGFGKVKIRSIKREDLGSNSKLNLQFSSKPWAAAGDAGDGISDTGLAGFWQSNFQANNPAIFIAMNNVDYAGEPAHGAASTAVRNQTLGWIDDFWPGASSAFINGQAYLDNWPADPWAKGSYSFYPPGGFCSWGGVQAEPRGGVAFAGEHTARYIERGFMNGAVASGERAARQITKMA